MLGAGRAPSHPRQAASTLRGQCEKVSHFKSSNYSSAAKRTMEEGSHCLETASGAPAEEEVLFNINLSSCSPSISSHRAATQHQQHNMVRQAKVDVGKFRRSVNTRPNLWYVQSVCFLFQHVFPSTGPLRCLLCDRVVHHHHHTGELDDQL